MGLRIVAMLCVVSLASGACLEGGLRGAMRLSDGEIVAQRCTSEEAICRLRELSGLDRKHLFVGSVMLLDGRQLIRTRIRTPRFNTCLVSARGVLFDVERGRRGPGLGCWASQTVVRRSHDKATCPARRHCA